MSIPIVIAVVIGVASAVGLGLVFAGYPLLLWLGSRSHEEPPGLEDGCEPAVTVLIAVRNGADLIGDKIANTLALDYPADRLRVIVSTDGCTDGTEDVVRSTEDERVRLVVGRTHDGKAAAINRGLVEATGDIVVMTDADAILDERALQRLVRHFADDRIGGVCGQRVIAHEGKALEPSQRGYVRLDSLVKRWESEGGSITSNDGKLYAIRRAGLSPVADGVTDDLYTCLDVIGRGFRFVFEPAAMAEVRLPSRSAGHELARRRRIVASSLRGISLNRRLLNPLRYGRFAYGLLINKVLRRMIPIMLIAIAASSVVVATEFPVVWALVAAQTLVYVAALSHPVVGRFLPAAARCITETPYYFCLGCAGMLLGLCDWVRGRSITKWDPVKVDR